MSSITWFICLVILLLFWPNKNCLRGWKKWDNFAHIRGWQDEISSLIGAKTIVEELKLKKKTWDYFELSEEPWGEIEK